MEKEGVYLGGTLRIQNSLILCQSEGSYPGGEVKQAQSSILGGSKACLGGSVSGESGSSGVVGPYTVLNEDGFLLVQAMRSHPEGEFGDELCVD